MSDETKTKEMVREMAKLSMLTDRISDVQEKNLKMYPFVFFEALTKAEISYNLSNDLGVSEKITEVKKGDSRDLELDYKIDAPETKHLRVSYYLTLDERLNGNLDKRFKAIEESVRNLFWKQITVEVYFNGTLRYKSGKNV